MVSASVNLLIYNEWSKKDWIVLGQMSNKVWKYIWWALTFRIRNVLENLQNSLKIDRFILKFPKNKKTKQLFLKRILKINYEV